MVIASKKKIGKGSSRPDFFKTVAMGDATSNIQPGLVSNSVATVAEGASGSSQNNTGTSTRGRDWLGKAPIISDSDIKETVKADVVVVGGGHAGLHAAWAAAKAGVTVSVIESQSEKKYTWFGEQVGHFNSQFLINQGFGPYDEGEIVNEFIKCGGNRVNAVLIKKYVHHSGRIFDNFMSLVPKGSRLLRALNVHQAAHNPTYPMERGGYKTWAGCAQFRGDIFEKPIRGIAANSQLPGINRLIVDDAKNHGAKWHFDYEAIVLIKNNERVTGCVAKNINRYTKFLGNKAVILATGDFSGNADMCNALINEIAELAAERGQKPGSIRGLGRSGAGHRMGIWAGGHLETSPRASMFTSRASGPFGMAPFLIINCKGERFMNEDIAIGHAPMIYRQPIGTITCVFDKNWPAIIEKCTVNHINPDYGVPEFIKQATEDMSHVLAAGKDGYNVRNTSSTERIPSKVYGANTLEKLSEMLGYTGKNKSTFLDSIKRYNELCAKGIDEDFGKAPDVLKPIVTPPFYGSPSDNKRISVGLVTLAGLVTDNDCNVLDDDNDGIKGLYAVGNCLGHRYANSYATPTAGNSIGMAMTHGMLVGEHVATL